MPSPDVYERDVLELGERAADCLVAEDISRGYPEPRMRAWSLILLWRVYATWKAPTRMPEGAR